MRGTWATAVNAMYTLAIQLIALLSLTPTLFGVFSIQYLFLALSLSVALSVVSEPWLRVEMRSSELTTWRRYSSTATYFALSCGLCALVISLVIPQLREVSALGAVAVASSTYRACARFYSVRRDDPRGVLPGDLAGLVVTVISWTVCVAVGYTGLMAVVGTWALGSLASALLSRLPTVGSPTLISTWFRQHRPDIGLLLRDSLLMDAGAIGTPYALAPVLGLTDFGIYRAVSNIAAPIRLVLNPLRPHIASRRTGAHRSPRTIGLVVGGSLIFGAAAYAALLVLGALGMEVGTLTELVPFATPAAVFVGSGFAGHYFYIVARAIASGRQLMVGRIVQTVLAIGFPLTGALGFGLVGSIWGVSLASAISATAWSILALRASRSSDPDR